MNIYEAFYRNWTKEHEALEVFLTHALTDLLNRITHSDPILVREFVLTVLLSARTPGKAAAASLKTLQQRLRRGADNLRWESQPSVALPDGSKKRADVSLYSGSDPHPLLIVEAKVSAKLGNVQLENYGKSLAHDYRGDQSPGSALIFLTHTTAQPDNFLKEHVSDYGVPLRAVSSWMEVHNWLSQSRLQRKDPFLVRLIEEFCGFMSEQNLNGITLADAKFLRELLRQGVGAKIEPLFKMIRNHVEPRMKNYDFRRLNPWDSTEGSAVWDWCYRKPPKLLWYVSWGLMVGGDFFGVPLPNKLLGFVAVEREEGGTKIPIHKLEKKLRNEIDPGWQFFSERNLCINCVDAQKLAEKHGGFTPSFIHWLIPRRLDEATEILTRSHALLSRPRQT